MRRPRRRCSRPANTPCPGSHPDGAHISALPPYLSGIGASWAAIVDENGTEVARYRPENGYVRSAVWEDDGHLLVTAYDWDARAWSVMRLGLDGSEELALGPSTATDECHRRTPCSERADPQFQVKDANTESMISCCSASGTRVEQEPDRGGVPPTDGAVGELDALVRPAR